MQPWLQRVIVEQTELNAKWQALATFIRSPEFAQLDMRSRDLLTRQEAAMAAYVGILAARIAHANGAR